MEGPISTFEAIALLVAAYGAVLSTILGITQLRQEKRKLRVSCRLDITSLPGGEMVDLVCIDVVNTGHRPVEVKTAGLLMSNGHLFTEAASKVGPMPLPKILQDGESVTIFFDLPKAKLAIRDADIPGLRFARAIVRDAEGREHSSDVPGELLPGPSPFLRS